jgi:glycerol-3-phosphate dehydrogenase (NAD(P)+)
MSRSSKPTTALKPSRLAVIGAGGWGTALATLLARSGHAVALWARNVELATEIRDARVNQAYLPDVQIPQSVQVTHQITDLAAAETLLFVTPSTALRAVAAEIAARVPLPSSIPLVSCTKGIEPGTGKRMSEILAEQFASNPVAVLSGPNHAEEVVHDLPSATVIGSDDESVATWIQQLVSSERFRAYTSPDVLGVELGGALKNIFAIAAGLADGLGLGDNSKAALVTRSFAELVLLGTSCGGRRETFFGLSGVGDLVGTCFSRHSRNRRVGERLGQGESLQQIVDSMQLVAEGIPTTRSAKECAARFGIETPIINEVYSVLYEHGSPADSMQRLLEMV